MNRLKTAASDTASAALYALISWGTLFGGSHAYEFSVGRFGEAGFEEQVLDLTGAGVGLGAAAMGLIVLNAVAGYQEAFGCRPTPPDRG